MKQISPAEAFLRTIHDKHIHMDKMIDTKISILTAIFAGTFFLSINRILSTNLRRPKIFQKKPLNLFFYDAKKLNEMLKNNILKEFSKEIYSLSYNVLIPGFTRIMVGE